MLFDRGNAKYPLGLDGIEIVLVVEEMADPACDGSWGPKGTQVVARLAGYESLHRLGDIAPRYGDVTSKL